LLKSSRDYIIRIPAVQTQKARSIFTEMKAFLTAEAALPQLFPAVAADLIMSSFCAG
jgi:hypothetical protein